MPSLASPAPPLSLAGTLAAIRRPSGHDIVFAAKTTIAAIVCLLIAFREDLQNPYWSALTVYVLTTQPQAGAVRSKAIFRLAGTLLGAVAAVALCAMFSSDVGGLLAATIAAIVLIIYLKGLDRTPLNYAWFVMALTLAVVGVAQVQAPETIFDFAAARTVEIGLAVLVVGLVDSLILPSPATPAFLSAMADWRDQAAAWAAAAMTGEPAASPQALRQLAAQLGLLDAAGVQLPYDVIPVPPRGRDLRFLRMTAAHLIAGLATLEAAAAASPQFGEARDWLLQRLAFEDRAILDHAARGEALRDRLAAGASENGVRGAALMRLSETLDHWRKLELTLHAIATGSALPPALRREARLARPARSTDYVLGLLDAAPMALALGVIAALWFATTWTAAISAMLFAFIALGFVGGTPAALRSAQGIILWIAITCAGALVYQFAVLPRVTDFPVLAAVFVVGVVPLSLLMTMSPAGLLIVANGLALIALQTAYAADFGASLDNLLGALAGCVVAAAALHLCRFDRARFIARRLVAALRQDIVDVARSRRPPGLERVVSLGVDRIALYAGAVGGLEAEDPFAAFRRAVDLARLRAEEPQLSAPTRAAIARLRGVIATTVKARAGRDRPDLGPSMQPLLEALLCEAASPSRTRALAALDGLREGVV
jgi:uncharacterized membrane protein YccC